MAGEIECYVMLPIVTKETVEAFFEPVDAAIKAAGVPLIRIEKERGSHQFEFVTSLATPEALAEHLATVRSIVEAHGDAQDVAVHFTAKPFADQPSSGMHIHTHLADADGINAYHKTEEWMSDALRFSLGGLLADLPNAMASFFPSEEDYARLYDLDHVPKIIGWGVNNRYCALRIPMEMDPYHKRIEHRMPCANANPDAVIEAVLRGILQGLRAKAEPPAQEYGKMHRPITAPSAP